jgi:hypothetical protein
MAALLLAGLCSVVMAQWSEPVNVTRTQVGSLAWYPSLTIDPFGTLHASWSHRMGGPGGPDWIEYSCKPASVDTWTIPVHVSRDSFSLRGSVIVMGPNNVPYIVWCSEAEAGHLYMVRKSGDTWTFPERNVAWNGGNTGIRAASDRFGRVHVVWWGDYYHIWYARYETPGGWTAPESIASSPGGVGYIYPSVAADRLGHAHVVYCGEGVEYLRQTDSGWTVPVNIGGSPEEPRIVLDTLDRPAVAWSYGGTYFTCWTGDSWTARVRLDSIDGYPATVCVDSWNRPHVFFGDGDERRHAGMREKVRYDEHWNEALLIDTIEGVGEPVSARERLHFVWNKRSPHYKDIWYSWRNLAPPAVSEGRNREPASSFAARPVPARPETQVSFTLDGPGSVVAEIVSVTGRPVRTVQLGRLDAGRHLFRPYPYLPVRGVYYCRIRTAGKQNTMKLVKVN